MLTTRHIEHPDYPIAATELLENAKRLIVAGHFEQALVTITHLLEPGPWKAGAHGRIASELERLLPLVCHLASKQSPAIGELPSMSREELGAWARKQVAHEHHMLAMPIRNQLTPAGENWSTTMLAAMPGIADADERNKIFGAFCVDAEFVLKAHLSKGQESRPVTDAGTPDAFSGLNILARLLGRHAPILIAPAAHAVSTAAIAQAAAAYLDKTGTPDGYMTDFIFHAAMVIALREGRPDEAARAAGSLAGGEMGLATLVHAALWPPVADMLRAGYCKTAVGVDDASIPDYLAALQRRRTMAAMPTPAPAYRADSLDVFRQRLAGSPLAGREIVELPILDTPERAYAIATTVNEMEAMWKAARALVDVTGRWPVLALCQTDAGTSLKDQLIEEDFFSRFEYEEAPDADDVSPRAILAAADTADVARFLRQRMRENEERMPLQDVIEFELDSTRRACGSAPSLDDVTHASIDGAPIATHYQLDRWLLDWERARDPVGNPSDARQEWFEEDPVVLLFLPTPNPWDTLAYLHWYGTSWHGVENYIALGRQWHQRHGAELVAHFGTMLQCFATRPPTTLDEAWQLAVEHDIAGPCTLALPGICLRHHAIGLLGYDRWFLHERP